MITSPAGADIIRKNFLFHDTVKGTRASSIIYSLVETAKLNNLNIYAYLETVLLYMPDSKNEPEGIEELMSWSDMIHRTTTAGDRKILFFHLST